jgi:hypothetical protein
MTSQLCENQDPFYFSAYDRYRLIELVFERERKAAGLTHEQLADRCDSPYVRPYHLTTLQHLTRTLRDPQHRLDRVRILMALTWGLQLPKWKVDLVLALFDGRPLSADECRRYLSSYSAEQSWAAVGPEAYEREGLRRDALRALGESLSGLWPSSGPTPVTVSIAPGAGADSWLVHASVTLALESEPGMRLVVKAEPSSVTDPPPDDFDEWVHRLGTADAGSVSLEQLQQIYTLMRRRHETWLARVEEHGQTAIHSRPALQRLLSNDQQRGRGLRQITRLVRLLRDHDAFHVALAETTPPLELLIVGLDRALMVGAGTPTVGWGNWPFLLSWDDPKAVLMFVDDFWKNYYAIEPANRDKASVIRQLSELAGLD